MIARFRFAPEPAPFPGDFRPHRASCVLVVCLKMFVLSGCRTCRCGPAERAGLVEGSEGRIPGVLDAALLAMVTLLGGMLFPYRKSIPELLFQLSLLPLTALYLALVLAWFGAGSKRASGLFARLRDMPLSPRFSMAVIAFFLGLSTGMTVYEGRLFSSMGYSMSPAGAVLLMASLLAVVAVLGFSSGGRHLGWSVLVSLVVIQLVSIRNFPLDPARSDMLPLIEAA